MCIRDRYKIILTYLVFVALYMPYVDLSLLHMIDWEVVHLTLAIYLEGFPNQASTPSPPIKISGSVNIQSYVGLGCVYPIISRV